MIAESAHLVAGVFKSQAEAEETLEDLHRIGLTDADLEVGAPVPGRYRVEIHESQEIGRAVVRGIAVGVPLGGIIATGFLLLVVPGIALTSAIGLGLAMGGYWGIFFGGLGGMALKVIAHDRERQYAIAPDSAEVLVIAHADDQYGAVHHTMANHGSRAFLMDVPHVRPAQLAAAG